MEEIIQQIELTTERLKLNLPERKRLIHNNIPIEKYRAVMIYGPRGVGKTIFLLTKIMDKNFLFFSGDNPIISPIPLYELVKKIFTKGYDGVVIDEVHFINNWSKHLKALYDDYPNHTIWISDSSNIILRKSVTDLSRRFIQFRMPMLSFREYLYLVEGIILDPIDIFNYDKSIFSKLKGLNILKLFQDYINSGIRPFFFEGEYCSRLKGILEKTIFYDIPFYVPSIQDNHLRIMNAIIGHMLISPVPTLNVSGMCADWGISKEKLYNLLFVMEQSELIRIIKKTNKKVGYSKGAKIFLADPSFYFCFSGNLGSARESFVTFALSERYEIFASDMEKEYDYLVDGRKIEVGGKNKKTKGADLVISDDIDLPFSNKTPMWMVGLVF